jgi:hypothetical protein
MLRRNFNLERYRINPKLTEEKGKAVFIRVQFWQSSTVSNKNKINAHAACC